LTPSAIEEIRTALAAASPAPWSRSDVLDHGWSWGILDRSGVTVCLEGAVLRGPDAILIAAAPAWLAALLDELEARPSVEQP
jgi:hypothetical protein